MGFYSLKLPIRTVNRIGDGRNRINAVNIIGAVVNYWNPAICGIAHDKWKSNLYNTCDTSRNFTS